MLLRLLHLTTHSTISTWRHLVVIQVVSDLDYFLGLRCPTDCIQCGILRDIVMTTE